MSIINWLEEWYESNCDGDWEHTFGIEIGTLDNPGWRVQLNVAETMYEDVNFNDVKIDRTDNDWMYFWKKDGVVHCAGGPKNLGEMLEFIRKWMDDNNNKPD